MDIRFLGAGAALLGVIVVSVALRGTDAATQNIPEMLKSANPELADAHVALVGCQLSIRNDTLSPDNLMASVVKLDADLRMFDFENVQIATKVDGQTVLRVRRAPAGPELLEQAVKVMALLPETLAPQAGLLTYVPGNGAPVAVQKVRTDAQNGWSRPQLLEFLSQPNATLTIRLDGVKTQAEQEATARIRPHPDAPKFYGFAEEIARIDGPKTVSSALIFAGDRPTPGQLVSGLVAIPNTLVLNVRSQIGARGLAQTLLDYKLDNCDA